MRCRRAPLCSAAMLVAALLAALACLRPAAAACTHPLKQQSYSLCGTPGQGTHSYSAPPNNWQSDNAVDLCAARLNVYAVEDGVICSACGFGWDPAWGYRLTLNAAKNQMFYTHLGYIDVKAGAYVRRGQFLGTIGDFRYGPTTNRFPPHLHFATRDGNALTYVRSCSRT